MNRFFTTHFLLVVKTIIVDEYQKHFLTASQNRNYHIIVEGWPKQIKHILNGSTMNIIPMTGKLIWQQELHLFRSFLRPRDGNTSPI